MNRKSWDIPTRFEERETMDRPAIALGNHRTGGNAGGFIRRVEDHVTAHICVILRCEKCGKVFKTSKMS
eukprot:TRINITY_DN11953_c0_g1_i1.p1 TRINITY_DN11953_c0_g1~~TRINITY_DN11953_c0_g1_i1.p1  ORF type:complete len:69 (-),score=12.45 TRINITY_DN11953_c0_g1_i1:346-552(-)